MIIENTIKEKRTNKKYLYDKLQHYVLSAHTMIKLEEEETFFQEKKTFFLFTYVVM